MRRDRVRRAGAAAAGVVAASAVGALVNLLTSGHGRNWILAASVAFAVLIWAAIEAWRATGDRPGRRVRLAEDAALGIDGPVVDRPEIIEQIAAALTDSDGQSGITVAIVGFGGFGKTTLARMVTADTRVRKTFDSIIVTLGQDVGGAALT